MDFRDLLLMAEKNHKLDAKQSQQVKRISTHFTTPAKTEKKSSQPKSEAVQKLLDEKAREKQRQKDAEEKERRRREKAKEELDGEEKHKSAFRIPKKAASEDPPSDAESFSSISSDEEPAPNSDALATFPSNEEKQSSSSKQSVSEKLSRHDHSSEKRGKHTSDKSSSKHYSSRSSKHTSGDSPLKEDDGHRSKSGKDGHSSSDKHDRSSSDKHSHSSSDKHKHLSSDKHRHSSSEKHKHSSSDKHRHSSSEKHKRSSSEKHELVSSDKRKHSLEKHSSSDKLKPSSEKHGLSSSKSHKSSSDKGKSHTRSSNPKQPHSSSLEHRYKDISMVTAEESSGYITSPDLTSDEEDASPKPSSDHKRRDSTGSKKEESADVPVTLNRHHLKPTVERQGGSLEERQKMLAKLQAIREKMMASEDTGPARKRAAKGEVKKRRAKREKLEGDFSGSCMEKIEYNEEEKPSLKRPEPKPEEPKPSTCKEKRSERRSKERSERSERRKSRSEHRKSSSEHKKSSREHKKSSSEHKSSREEKVNSGSKLPSKSNRFDTMREKPKIKPKPRPRPPPVNFAELLKMAEEQQAQPVMVEVVPKKEKERRPMTQEEIDRKRAREERLKTKDYKDWYKFGEQVSKAEQSARNDAGDNDANAGGFLRRDHKVVPSTSDTNLPKPAINQHRGDSSASARPEKANSSSSNNRPSSSQTFSKSHSPPGFKPKPHPTRPGMIANKPHAMAQHFNNGHKNSLSGRTGGEPKKRPALPESRSQGSPRDTSPQPRPGAAAEKTKGGNAWDTLFSRPEYKKLKAVPAPKKKGMVIDSDEEEEEEDDMDDFIDDEGEEDMDVVSGAIKDLFGYDKRKYRNEDDDDRSMEVGFSQIMKEEARSARIGRQEDLEDIRLEEEELKRKAMRKKMR